MAEICSTGQDALPGLGSRFEESLAKPGAVESMIEKYTATGGKLDSGFELATDTVGNYDLAGKLATVLGDINRDDAEKQIGAMYCGMVHGLQLANSFNPESDTSIDLGLIFADLPEGHNLTTSDALGYLTRSYLGQRPRLSKLVLELSSIIVGGTPTDIGRESLGQVDNDLAEGLAAYGMTIALMAKERQLGLQTASLTDVD